MTTLFYSPRYGPRPRAGEGVYGASRLAELKTVFTEEGSLICHELSRHEITEKIPEFRLYGWSPHLDFDKAGFKLEEMIDLPTIQPEIYRQRYTGSPKIIHSARKKIDETINRLNTSNIPFIDFRIYAHWPKVWDTVYFYSIGNFKDEPLRMPIR